VFEGDYCRTPSELYLTRKRSSPPELDVPYRTLWGWINESEEYRKRYDESLEEQYEMIRIRVGEVIESMRQDLWVATGAEIVSNRQADGFTIGPNDLSVLMDSLPK
jgi:hypothetical protein